MSVTELENRIVKMQEWEQLAQDAAAEAEAIRDTIKAEMLARDTEELTAGRFIVRWRSVLTSRFNSSEFKRLCPTFMLHLHDRAKAAAFLSAHKERPLVRTPTKASGQAA